MSGDKQIADILNRYGEDFRSSVWRVQGQAVIYHKALERIAARALIRFDLPQILRAEGEEAVILVAGQMGDQAEWSIGEAKIGVNYRVSGKQAAYPYAMAEKRANDRVILKLIGLHGLLYSEDEVDDFKEAAPAFRGAGEDLPGQPQANRPPGQEPPIELHRPRAEVMDEAINGGTVQLEDGEVTRASALRRKVEASSIGRKLAAAKTVDDIAAVLNNPLVKQHIDGLHPDHVEAVHQFAQERHLALSVAAKNSGGANATAPASDTIEEPFDAEAKIAEIGEAYLTAQSMQDIEDVRDTFAEANDRLSMAQRERVADLDAKAVRRIGENADRAANRAGEPASGKEASAAVGQPEIANGRPGPGVRQGNGISAASIGSGALRFSSGEDYRHHIGLAVKEVLSAEAGEKLRALWNSTKEHRKALGLSPQDTKELKTAVAQALERVGVPTKATAKREAAHVG